VIFVYGGYMGVEIIFKIAAIGILTAVVGQVLKHSGKDEIATMATLAGLIIVLVMVLDLIMNLFDVIKNMFNF
jgi:stage III sporulation protein AC